MAHEICSIAWAGEMPWHGLGIRVEELMTLDEALIKGGLDWSVELAPLVVSVDGALQEVRDKQVTIRSDTKQVLGVVGARYEPIQNRQTIDVFREITGMSGGMIEVAGCLGRGERMWLLGKLPKDIRIKGTDDITHQYVLLFNSHDGTQALTLGLTPVRVVCANTVRVALSRGLDCNITIRHTVSYEARLAEVTRALQYAGGYFEAANEVFNLLATVPVNREKLDRFLDEVVPIPDKRKAQADTARNEIVRLFETSPTITAFPQTVDTAYALFNAAAEFADHHKKIRASDVRNEREARFLSIMGGSIGAFTQKAYDAALAIAA